MIHYMLLLNVEDISKGNASLSELPHTLNIYSGNIDVSFVLSSKGTLVCNSSSSVLVLNRTSPSLLHTFVAYTTQLSIAIQHNGNSFLHQHIQRKRLRASSCLNKLCLDFVKKLHHCNIRSYEMRWLVNCSCYCISLLNPSGAQTIDLY